MSQLGSIKNALLAVSRSWFVRIFIALSLIVVISYKFVLVPWINTQIGVQYANATGHQLSHDPIGIKLFSAQVQLNHLKDSANLWALEKLQLDMLFWESIKQKKLVINRVLMTGLEIHAKQLDDTHWSFDDLLLHQRKLQQEKKSTPTSTLPLKINVFAIENASVHTNLWALGNRNISISPLAINLRQLDFSRAQTAEVSSTAKIDNQIVLTVSGQLDLLNLTGNLNVQSKDIPFDWFNPVIKPFFALDILNGKIDVKNDITLVRGNLTSTVTSGELLDLKLRPTSMEQDAVKWKSLSWQGAQIDFQKLSAHAPLVTLNGLDGQFIIAKDRTTNLQAMLLKPNAQVIAQKTRSAEVSPTPQWQFDIDKIVVQNAAIGFNDQSLTPSFTAIVQQFSGEISHISSNNDKTTDIKLLGNVDGYAPVTLNGKAKLFLPQPQIETVMNFQKMDMGAFTPYSAEYAGWRIKKGLLSVNLDYHYDQGKVIGKNHVVIDHLEFGEKVRSTHVIDIPLRLGLALLTDENGIAVLDAEITGDPKDPNFNVRAIVWRALGNTLKKIITAPFRWLGDLVSTKEDLGRVTFTAGESQLTEPTIAKLNLLQQVLVKRPNMRLSLRGVYDQNTDVRALKQEQVNSQLQKLGVTLASINAQDERWVKAINALYESKKLSTIAADAVTKNAELLSLEVVDQERLNKLSHERAQAVKQYFVLNLHVPSENLLLDSSISCDGAVKCSTSDVIFTLEE